MRLQVLVQEHTVRQLLRDGRPSPCRLDTAMKSPSALHFLPNPTTRKICSRWRMLLSKRRSILKCRCFCLRLKAVKSNRIANSEYRYQKEKYRSGSRSRSGSIYIEIGEAKHSTLHFYFYFYFSFRTSIIAIGY